MTGKDKSLRHNPLINYFEESYQEVRKVSWPTKNQALRLTFLVLGFCVVTAIIIGAFDFGFSEGYKSLKRYSDVVVPKAALKSPVTATTGAEQPISVTGATANGQPITVDATGATSGQPITLTPGVTPTAPAAPATTPPTAPVTAPAAPASPTN